MVIGTLFALANGGIMPLFALLWGDILNSFNQQDLVEDAKNTMLKFIYIGLGAFVSGWIMIACWVITAERQAI